MDLAFVRKSATANAIILQDLLERRRAYSSSFMLIEETTSRVAWPLLKHLQATEPSLVLEASDLTTFGHTDVNQDVNLVFVKDTTVELLNDRAYNSVLKNLSRLSRHHNNGVKCTLVVDVQCDILPRQTIAALEFMAETVVIVEKGPLPLLLSVTHRLTGGKIKQERIIFENGRFAENNTANSGNTPVLAMMPTSTFKLGLTAEQATAKASVALPHLRAQMSEMEIGSSRNILADDYDEEDPDADLEL